LDTLLAKTAGGREPDAQHLIDRDGLLNKTADKRFLKIGALETCKNAKFAPDARDRWFGRTVKPRFPPPRDLGGSGPDPYDCKISDNMTNKNRSRALVFQRLHSDRFQSYRVLDRDFTKTGYKTNLLKTPMAKAKRPQSAPAQGRPAQQGADPCTNWMPANALGGCQSSPNLAGGQTTPPRSRPQSAPAARRASSEAALSRPTSAAVAKSRTVSVRVDTSVSMSLEGI